MGETKIFLAFHNDKLMFPELILRYSLLLLNYLFPCEISGSHGGEYEV
jgi:hypothetical protein